MALAQVQRALATLATSEDARARFRGDARAFAREFQLTNAETAALETLGDRRLHAYVDSLDRKRASEAARLLPLAARLRGAAFRRAFLTYARHAPLPTGNSRYVRDAIRFASLAVRDESVPQAFRDLLDYEATCLRTGEALFGTSVRRYAHAVTRFARELANGVPGPPIAKRTTLVFWIAFVGLHVSFSLPIRNRSQPLVLDSETA